MKRFLIISADDFGISESTNGAIEELFDGEKITSAGILAPAPHAREAALLAAEKGYSVGVHWTLNSEWGGSLAWLSCAGNAPSLLENGRLTADMAIVKKATSGDVTRELEAQYQTLVDWGCTPDHADSHCGTLYGINGRLFFLNAYRLCKKYGLPYRFCRNDNFLIRQFGHAPGLPLRAARKAISGIGAVQGVRLLDDFYSDPRSIEAIGSPGELKAYYENQLRTLSGSVCEVFMHPCLPDDALLERSSQWRKRVWEYEYLKSGDLLRAAREAGFTVVSWGRSPLGKDEYHENSH